MKAEERISATAAGSHELFILSGKAGESRTNTSVGDRRPRSVAEVRSSCFRTSPSLSAFPDERRVQLANVSRERMRVPVLRHNILTWLPRPTSVSARSVGEKNIASSSGCAMRRQIRLLRNLGNETRVRYAV